MMWRSHNPYGNLLLQQWGFEIISIGYVWQRHTPFCLNSLHPQ